MVGVDVHLRSLLVAKRLADRLVPDNPPMFVLADARRLPFAPGGFDGVYSYSVVQHFSRENAERILAEAGRVLKRGGCAVIQMPNRDGLKTALTQHRARDRDGEEFEVRYYRIEELLALFQRAIGNARWSVDCFFGLNVHSRDRDLVPASRRWVVDLATLFERLSRRFKPLGRWADSVFVTATKA
jgi:SAM-dependent methyltransferase